MKIHVGEQEYKSISEGLEDNEYVIVENERVPIIIVGAGLDKSKILELISEIDGDFIFGVTEELSEALDNLQKGVFLEYWSGCNNWTNRGSNEWEPVGTLTAMHECEPCSKLDTCMLKQRSPVFALKSVKLSEELLKGKRKNG